MKQQLIVWMIIVFAFNVKWILMAGFKDYLQSYIDFFYDFGFFVGITYWLYNLSGLVALILIILL